MPDHRGRKARSALCIVMLGAVFSIAQADVDVKDIKTREVLEEIDSRLGDGDLNKSAANIDKTTSNLLKEIQTGVASLGFTATLTPNNQLQKIGSVAAYVQQACPEAGGSGPAAGAVGASNAGATQNITSITVISADNASKAKQDICKQLIQLRVQGFNESIDMANRFQQYSKQLTSIEDKRGEAKTQGDLWANTNEALRTMNKLQAEMGFWRARLAAYEAAIKFHEGQQNSLSQTAIKGSGAGGGRAGGGGLLGSVIQTTALAAALAIR